MGPRKHAWLVCTALGATGGALAAEGEIGTVAHAHKCEQAISRLSKHTSLVPTLRRLRLQRRVVRGVDLVEMWHSPGTLPTYCYMAVPGAPVEIARRGRLST